MGIPSTAADCDFKLIQSVTCFVTDLADTSSMNRLETAKRAQILGMLVEGMSMRAVTRLTGVSINTVSKLLMDAGEAWAAYHDENVRGVESARIQADEIWSFVYAKEKNVGKAKDAPAGAGDAWTWTALDADCKLIVSWVVGNRNATTALYLMDDVQQRLTRRVQLTTDGHRAYLDAVEATFGPEIDYAMLVKIYGSGGDDSQRRYSPGECLGARKVIVPRATRTRTRSARPMWSARI